MSNEQQEHIPVPAPVFSGNIWTPSPGLEGVRIGSAMPVDLDALIRDGKRFRKLEARMEDDRIPIRIERWNPVWNDWDTFCNSTLAEIADALPEVES